MTATALAAITALKVILGGKAAIAFRGEVKVAFFQSSRAV